MTIMMGSLISPSLELLSDAMTLFSVGVSLLNTFDYQSLH